MFLFIFDINGTLADATWKKKRNCVYNYRTERGKYVSKRPFFDDIVEIIKTNNPQTTGIYFAIWSSCEKENVHQVNNLLFSKETLDKFLFIKDRSHCTLGNKYDSKKDLNNVWKEYPQFNKENTILIDDSKEKIMAFQENCHYHIPSWEVGENSGNDSELKAIKMLFIDKLI